MASIPVYLLIDVSKKMQGEPLEATQTVLDSIASSLNGVAVDICLCVITFSTRATVARDLSRWDSKKHQMPVLRSISSLEEPKIDKGLKCLWEEYDTHKDKHESLPLLVFVTSGDEPSEYNQNEFEQNRFDRIVVIYHSQNKLDGFYRNIPKGYLEEFGTLSARQYFGNLWEELGHKSSFEDIKKDFEQKLQEAVAERDKAVEERDNALNVTQEIEQKLQVAETECSKAKEGCKKAEEERDHARKDARDELETERIVINDEANRRINEAETNAKNAIDDAQQRIDGNNQKTEVEIKSVRDEADRQVADATKERDIAIENEKNAVKIAREQVEIELKDRIDETGRLNGEAAKLHADGKQVKDDADKIMTDAIADWQKAKQAGANAIDAKIKADMAKKRWLLSGIAAVSIALIAVAFSGYSMTLSTKAISDAKVAIEKAEERETEASASIVATAEANKEAQDKLEAANQTHNNAKDEQKKVDDAREQLLVDQEQLRANREEVARDKADAEQGKTAAIEHERIAKESEANAVAAKQEADNTLGEARQMMDDAQVMKTESENRIRDANQRLAVAESRVKELEALVARGNVSLPPLLPENSRLGISVTDNNGFGVRITAVAEGSAGKQAELQPDDLILMVDDKRLTSPRDYSTAIDAVGERVRLVFRKAGSERNTAITLILSEE